MRFRSIFMLAVMGFIMATVGCGGGEYDEVVEVNTRFIEAMQTYISSLGEAASAKEVANAISKYADAIESLGPKMKEIRGKFPELNSSKDIPDELKAVQMKSEELQQQVVNSYMNLMKYVMDPDVQKAQKRLQEAMMKLG